VVALAARDRRGAGFVMRFGTGEHVECACMIRRDCYDIGMIIAQAVDKMREGFLFETVA